MARHKRRRTKKAQKTENLLPDSQYTPMELIEGLANGQDLTHTSCLLNFIEERQLCAEELPSEQEWHELYNIITTYYRFAAVKTSERLNAAKALAEYRHSKRKATEETDSAHSLMDLPPLTDAELDKFWESFARQGLG